MPIFNYDSLSNTWQYLVLFSDLRVTKYAGIDHDSGSENALSSHLFVGQILPHFGRMYGILHSSHFFRFYVADL